jgi:hypothetical protein
VKSNARLPPNAALGHPLPVRQAGIQRDNRPTRQLSGERTSRRLQQVLPSIPGVRIGIVTAELMLLNCAKPVQNILHYPVAINEVELEQFLFAFLLLEVIGHFFILAQEQF